MNTLYTFIYRGVLTEESLDKAGRKRRRHFGSEDVTQLRKALSFDMLDEDLLADAQRMSIVYTAIHAFENMVRYLVQKVMAEKYGEKWWEKVPDKIRKKVETRVDEDTKFRWHGARGGSDITYCDFGDLSSIINTNWALFENVLTNLEWTKSLLNTLEKSRNIVMHGGVLVKEDIERIGMNIRDWIRQAG
ncbi:MAG: Swt1 family HEPN domain-containing protein [Candidatus Thorarchaeota archaeon]